MKKIIKKLKSNPKNIFVIDALGALLTSIFLFVISRKLCSHFGISSKTLTCLSVIALIFFFYSISCFFLLKKNWRPYLRIICIANLLYCILTFGLIIYHQQSITPLGISYFMAEIFIISGLVYFELITLNENIHS